MQIHEQHHHCIAVKSWDLNNVARASARARARALIGTAASLRCDVVLYAGRCSGPKLLYASAGRCSGPKILYAGRCSGPKLLYAGRCSGPKLEQQINDVWHRALAVPNCVVVNLNLKRELSGLGIYGTRPRRTKTDTARPRPRLRLPPGTPGAAGQCRGQCLYFRVSAGPRFL